jgi:16S rRNA (cytosine1402-N4)-methyltransferase
MAAEVLAALRPHPHGRYADGTLGGAGHAASILAASSPTGWLSGCDRDGVAIETAKARLNEKYAGRFEIRRGNFAELADWVAEKSCAGVLLDLGVSSPQLDVAERGFSFMQDGPLDMRMDDRQPVTAADLVNGEDAEPLAKIFWEYGDERDSRRFARAIVHDRALRKFETTKQLSDLIARLAPRHGKKAHPATKVFQALRIAVNDEIGSLKRGLEGAVKILQPGGREKTRDYTFPGEVDVPELRTPIVPELKWVSRKAILPGEVELKENPRARSAQLRVLEKI